MVMRTVADILDRDLALAEGAALQLAERHRDTIMCGRSHGQPGLPITFGFKAAVWVSEMRRHRVRLNEGRKRWEVAQLGGALGTMEFWGIERCRFSTRSPATSGWQLPTFHGSPPGTGSQSSSACLQW